MRWLSPIPLAMTLSERVNKRRKLRQCLISILFVVAAVCVWAGTHGLLIKGLPAEYVGYILAVTGILGFIGINIWYGGPLDLRFDRNDIGSIEELGSATVDQSNEFSDSEGKL